MAIEKGLYAAPQGIADIDNDSAPPVEIEIENPDDVTLHIGDLEVDLMGDKDEEDFASNLAESMDEGSLQSLASQLVEEYTADVASRKDWIQTYVDGLELLGLKIEERAEPWEGACGVYHPLLSEALVKFQAETMMAIFPAAGPVRTLIIGEETPETKQAANRVQDDMNYQLTEKMPEYRPETERMLWGLGLSGNAFKKIYFDPALNRQVAIYVPAEDVVVPYGASNLHSAERVTHVMRKTENELKRLQVSGFYRDIELGEPMNVLDEVEKKIAEKLGFTAVNDNRYKILEMQVDLMMEDDPYAKESNGIALPYIVTIDSATTTVLAIRRNWEPDDKTFQKRDHFVHYAYIPGFGFYAFGLVHLIGGYAKSGTSLIRQLVDAGSLANLPGGFKTRGLRIKDDDTPIAPGEFKDVDVASGVLKDNIMPLPYKEPSQTLMVLLNQIVEEGRRFANTADLQISDMSAQAPVGTTLAILERTLKVMSSIQARIHFTLKQELKLLKKIIADYTPEDYDYNPEVGSRLAKKSDYSMVDVIPVSDPNASTMAQKIVQYQAVLQLAQSAPMLYNLPLLHRQMLDALGIKDAEKLVPMPDDMQPQDPVTENQSILEMRPVKAFAYQDHQAHIAVHMSAMQDPQIMQMLQSNPQAPIMQQAMMAHINEHLGFQYRNQIEQQLGFTLPPQVDQNNNPMYMPPDQEARLAPLLATAAQRLLAQSQGQAAQQQAQQQAQDPMVQLQQQDLQLKQQAQAHKQQKDQADIALKNKQLELEATRIAATHQAQLHAQKLSALSKAAQLDTQRKQNLMNTGVDVLKHLSDQHQEAMENNKQLGMQALTEATKQAAASKVNTNNQPE